MIGTVIPYSFEPCEEPLKVYIGDTDKGRLYLDLEVNKHVLVAGSTETGKSNLLHNMILSYLMNNHDIELHLVDFHKLEFYPYQGFKKVKTVCETPEQFSELLSQLEEEYKSRSSLFRSTQVHSFDKYNRCFPDKKLPYVVIMIDEFSCLYEREYEEIIDRLKKRVAIDSKVGLYYLISVNHPARLFGSSFTANMPTRIVFKTTSDINQRVILDGHNAQIPSHPGRCIILHKDGIDEVQTMYLPHEDLIKFLKRHRREDSHNGSGEKG